MSETVTREKSPRAGLGMLLMQTINGQKGPKTTILLLVVVVYREVLCKKYLKMSIMCSDCKDFKMMKS